MVPRQQGKRHEFVHISRRSRERIFPISSSSLVPDIATGLIDMCVLRRLTTNTARLDIPWNEAPLALDWMQPHYRIPQHKITVSLDRINQLLILPGMNRVHTATVAK